LNENDLRPNPDLLLKAVQREEQKKGRGRLKIFLGMAAGVGKTYAMLSAARELKGSGVDVVIGLVETHGRVETEALLKDLEIIPRRIIPYRDVELGEMDLDGLLKRRPAVALVDELAHTNAPGSRHARRFQDVLELLDAGIDVYTTVNVQHLESLADTVREITGITIGETVPDSVIDLADEVVLVDLAPDELLKRLSEGKVYGVERAGVAIQNFFRPGNLTALRELSLRMVAERVNRDLRDYQQVHHIREAWKTQYRLMVAVYASPYSEILIRWTRRMAAGLDAQWFGAYVESEQRLSEKERQLLSHNLALVKELGGEVLETVDENAVDGLLRLARENQITQLVVGKSRRSFFQNLRQGGSITNRLLNESGKIDIYIVSGEPHGQGPAPEDLIEKERKTLEWGNYLAALLTPAAIALAGRLLSPLIGYRAIGMLFLLGVTFLGLFIGRAPVLLAALLSGLLWDFFFIPPHFTFSISQPEDIITLGIFLGVAFITGHLTTRLKNNERLLVMREQRITALYQLTKEIASATSIAKVMDTAVKQIGAIFDAEVAVLVKQPDQTLSAHSGNTFSMDDKEKTVAEWVALHSRPAGLFTDTLPSARAFYLPLVAHQGTVGVLGLRPCQKKRTTPDLMTLAETFARQLAVGIEREQAAGKPC